MTHHLAVVHLVTVLVAQVHMTVVPVIVQATVIVQAIQAAVAATKYSFAYRRILVYNMRLLTHNVERNYETYIRIVF